MEKNLVRLDIFVPASDYDVLSGLLTLMVSSGWEEQSLPEGETLFRIHCENATVIQDVRQAVESRLPEVTCQIDNIVEQDWLTAWKDFFTPVPCGQRFVVLPPWLSQKSGFEDRIEIVIEPKSAFGTGHHATTALCLGVLSDLLDTERILPGQSFLDLGTGSGVLGLGLCKSGLQGEGYDIDPIAVDNALENREINAIAPESFACLLGGVEKVAGKQYDVVVANILARPLIEMAPQLVAAKKQDGVLVLSGILSMQADEVAAAYMACGLEQPTRIESGEWAALLWA